MPSHALLMLALICNSDAFSARSFPSFSLHNRGLHSGSILLFSGRIARNVRDITRSNRQTFTRSLFPEVSTEFVNYPSFETVECLMHHPVLGYLAISVVGLVLGLLGGGGSILALPIFMLVFHHTTDIAMAESLAVVSIGAAVGFLSHLRAGTVDLAVAGPFSALAMTGSYFGSIAAVNVSPLARLTLFFIIAVSSSAVMFRGALRDLRKPAAIASAPAAAALSSSSTLAVAVATPGPDAGQRRFGPTLAAQAAVIGALTAVAGTGGGFLVVPALTTLACLPIRTAVGSALLVVALNAAAGFAGAATAVSADTLDLGLCAVAAGLAGTGALAGARLACRLPAPVVRLLFAAGVMGLAAWAAIRVAALLIAGQTLLL